MTRREDCVTITFEECRGKNGVPNVILPIASDDELLVLACEGLMVGANEYHPGLGTDLNWRDFELVGEGDKRVLRTRRSDD